MAAGLNFIKVVKSKTRKLFFKIKTHMKIKRTSWHAKFYKAIYVANTLPTNLCPYFWKLVLAVITLPITSVSFLGRCRSFGDRFAWLVAAFFIELVIFAVGLPFSIWLGFISADNQINWHDFFIANGMGIAGCAAIALIGYLCEMLSKRNYKTAKVKEKQPNILVEFVKAKKNKHCPMIEWED